MSVRYFVVQNSIFSCGGKAFEKDQIVTSDDLEHAGGNKRGDELIAAGALSEMKDADTAKEMLSKQTVQVLTIPEPPKVAPAHREVPVNEEAPPAAHTTHAAHAEPDKGGKK